MSAWSQRSLLTAALAATAGLVGCGTNNDEITAVSPVASARLLVVHVSPDAPKFNVSLDGVTLGGPIAYPNATGYMNAGSSSAHLQVNTTVGAPVLDQSIPVEAASSYSVFACDSLAQIKIVQLTDDLSPVTPGRARVRFVNLAAGQPALDLARSGVGVLAGNLAFMQSSPWMLVNSGKYDLEADTSGTVAVYASQTGMTLVSRSIYTIYVRGPGKSGLPKTAGLVSLVHP